MAAPSHGARHQHLRSARSSFSPTRLGTTAIDAPVQIVSMMATPRPPPPGHRALRVSARSDWSAPTSCTTSVSARSEVRALRWSMPNVRHAAVPPASVANDRVAKVGVVLGRESHSGKSPASVMPPSDPTGSPARTLSCACEGRRTTNEYRRHPIQMTEAPMSSAIAAVVAATWAMSIVQPGVVRRCDVVDLLEAEPDGVTPRRHRCTRAERTPPIPTRWHQRSMRQWSSPSATRMQAAPSTDEQSPRRSRRLVGESATPARQPTGQPRPSSLHT